MTVKKFDQQKLQQCVDVLDVFARSGLSVQAFAQAQGLSYGQLRGWLAHGPRWRAQLAGEIYTPPAQARVGKASCFIQLKVRAENSRLRMERDILKKPRRTSRGSRCEVRLDSQTQGPLACEPEL